jgi:hypothetical protein
LDKHVPVPVANFQNNWLRHSSPGIDLAIFFPAPLLE